MTTQAQTNLSDYLTKRMPKRETRAVWLTTLASLDWPKNYARSEESIKLQKQELIDILDKYQKANINTVLRRVCVQLRFIRRILSLGTSVLLALRVGHQAMATTHSALP